MKSNSEKFRGLGLTVLVLAAITLLPSASNGTTLLPPGGCVGTCTTSLGTVDSLSFSGSVIANTGVEAFSGVNILGQTKYTGKAQEEVVQEASGLLDFVYQFQDLTGDPILSLAVTDYTGFVTIVGTNAGNLFTPPGGTESPSDISRNSPGDTITFDFAPNTPSGVPNGVETLELVIKTNATNFEPGSLNFNDGAVASVIGFAPAPTSQTPEPATMALFGTGLLGLAARIRRKVVRR